MTDLDQLISKLGNAIAKPDLIKLGETLGQQYTSLQELISLTLHQNRLVAINAARLTEYLLTKYPKNYIADLEQLIVNVKAIKHRGCVRHYASTLVYLTSPDVPREVRIQLRNTEMEPVIEQCFGWITDPVSIVTVKYAAAETLFNLRHRYPWVAEELSIQLEKLLTVNSPLLASKVSTLLGYLHCE